MAIEKAKTIIIETNYWKFGAWTVPISALGAIFFFYIVGWDDLLRKSITIGGIFFFTIAVYWWWWAISKISQFSKMIDEASERMLEIKRDVSDIRNVVNDSDRQR